MGEVTRERGDDGGGIAMRVAMLRDINKKEDDGWSGSGRSSSSFLFDGLSSAMVPCVRAR